MKIEEIRIYAECLEQGLDFKGYLLEIDFSLKIKNIYLSKFKNELLKNDSILQKILKLKNFDLAISILSNNQEIPILLIEYSTAVPTDDHKMQRSDVYFWASIFEIPVLKISPHFKNSFGKHGGGDKISLEYERNLALHNNAVVYFIDFKAKDNLLITDKNKLSCIEKSLEINNILKNLLELIKNNDDFNEVYKALLNALKTKYYNVENIENLKNIFVDSTRFQKESDDIIVKINRFGHAMDPDRGILFFMNMLFSNNNTISKIILQREKQSGKESYDALFHTFPLKKLSQINHLISQGIDSKNALEIFKIATGISDIFIAIDSNHYHIQDEIFLNFLQTYTSNVYKSIFINTKALRLCDYNNNLLCEIAWNPIIAIQYLNALKNTIHKTPLPLIPLDFESAKEDIITLASVEIFRKIGCEILAVSYPGAQGDKAILIGSGRSVKRIYVDMIASKQKDKFYIFLHENKDLANKLGEDSKKLNDLKNNHTDSINTFLHKVNYPNAKDTWASCFNDK